MDIRKSRWDKTDLTRRLCHALNIARKAVERLATNGYTDATEPGNNVRPEKVISETALLLLAASATPHHNEVIARIREVAQLLIPYARSERMLLGVCLEPALAMDYAQAHICLSRLGYMDEGFDTLLRQSMNSHARTVRERVPHRVLEQEWLTETWSNSRPSLRKSTPATALHSVLNQPMDLVGGSREDIYAFTHALMYVSDFNVWPRRLPRSRAVILAEAEAALARCLDEQDYDLGGEVLLAWPLTGRSWNAAAAFGFRVLAHVEDRAGFLPAPSTRLQRLNELEGDARTDYLLATAYHTAFVMGLLCAASLQAGRTPPAQIPARAAVRGAASMILPFLETDDPDMHWREEFDQLSDMERDALAGLLLNMALRRSVKKRAFGVVHQILKVGHALGLTGTPAASQAAEMLERLATFANITASPRGDPARKLADPGRAAVMSVSSAKLPTATAPLASLPIALHP
jgi:hypothetical protein